MWKLVYASVQGTTHRKLRQPCQDHVFGTIVPAAMGPVLVAACSDGAGGAESSAAGSRVACETILHGIFHTLKKGLPVAKLDKPGMVHWYQDVREALSAEARARRVPLHEMACTLLTAVVDAQMAVFAQVGDGAIVIRDEELHRPVFWPQAGPHPHTTNFVTDPQFADHLDFLVRERPVQELALLTDGLQQLALNFGTKKARPAFFRKLFEPLRRAGQVEGLTLPLRVFLNSPAVNRRTNDDKTLLLATRLDA